MFLLPSQVSCQVESKQQKIYRLASILQSGNEEGQRQAVLELSKLLASPSKASIEQQIQWVLERGEKGEEAIPSLIEVLKTNENPEVLDAVAGAFGRIGKVAVPDLIGILEEENLTTRDSKVLRYTANALKNIAKRSDSDSADFQDAVPPLIEILRNQTLREENGASNHELQDFDAAADCLAYIGKEAKAAVPLLIELAKNEDRRKEDHYRLTDSIVAIIKDLKIHSDFSANDAISNTFDKYEYQIKRNDRQEIAESIDELKTSKNIQDFKRLFLLGGIFGQYPYLKWVVIVVSFFFLAWIAFLIRPLWLLKFYEVFPVGDIRLPGVLGTVIIPIQYLSTAYVFRARVLDGWVKTYLPKARANFLNKQTVKDRQTYVPVALRLNGRLIPEFTAKDLRETCARNQARLLISGGGGAGKTSLACQVSRWGMRENKSERLWPGHVMLPVLLEHDFVDEGEDAMSKAISSQLRDLIDTKTAISRTLLQALLENKRILVLVDGMSEMNERTRNAILSGISRIPVNAVMFTSRTDEIICDLTRTTINPTTIKGNQLSSFVEAYLISQGKKQLSTGEEFFKACDLLSTIVRDRDITALLAKLFVDQMVAKHEKVINEDLPKSIPELMLQSIELLHAKTPFTMLALADVIKAAKKGANETRAGFGCENGLRSRKTERDIDFDAFVI